MKGVERVLWFIGLSHRLQQQQSIWALIHVPLGPLSTQIPLNAPGKAMEDGAAVQGLFSLPLELHFSNK